MGCFIDRYPCKLCWRLKWYKKLMATWSTTSHALVYNNLCLPNWSSSSTTASSPRGVPLILLAALELHLAGSIVNGHVSGVCTYVCGMYMYIHRIILVHVACQHNIFIYEKASLVYMYALSIRTCTCMFFSFTIFCLSRWAWGCHTAVVRPIVIDTPNWPPLHCCRNRLLICACDCHSYYFLKLVSTGLV